MPWCGTLTVHCRSAPSRCFTLYVSKACRVKLGESETNSTSEVSEMLSPRDAAQKWLNRARTAGDAIRAGVNAMTEADNPLEKAAAREQYWAQRVQEAAQQRKFSRGLRNVTFQQWREAMITKGIPNYANGLNSGASKLQNFMESWLPWIQQGQQRLRDMPRGTLQQNIQRMTTMVEHLANFRRQNLGDFPGRNPNFPVV